MGAGAPDALGDVSGPGWAAKSSLAMVPARSRAVRDSGHLPGRAAGLKPSMDVEIVVSDQVF